jgi:hypothetical protein
MIVLGRDVFVCKCSTNVRPNDPNQSEVVRHVTWIRGGEAELARLDTEYHGPEHVIDFRSRLERREYWLVGMLNDDIVAYTWLHARASASYPYLPGCTFELAAGVGYGYDAWTLPALRGEGLRRRGFLEELDVLRTTMGSSWEASFFVKHQLDGASRSLATVGIEIIPLWRVRLGADRKITFDKLIPSDTSAVPRSADKGACFAIAHAQTRLTVE